MDIRKSIQLISSIIVCIFLGYSPVFSQESELDSLVAQLENMPEDEEKVDYLVGIAKSLYYSAPSKGLEYVRDALDLAEKLGYENGDIYKTRGNLKYTQGDYKEALDDYILSLEIFMDQEDTLNQANVYNNIGILYEDQANYPEAKKYYASALEIFQHLNDFHGQATIYLNLGWLYDHDGQPDSAIYNYNRSYDINKEVKDEVLAAILQNNLGVAYMHKGSYDTADHFFNEGLERFRNMRDVEGVTESYRYKGELSMIKGDIDQGLTYLKEAEELALPHSFKQLLVETYELKSEAYESLGDYQKSLDYHQKFKSLSDSIFTAEKDQALFALQMNQQYEREKAILNQQNQIQEERLKAAKFKNFLLLAISLFSLIVMLISAYYFMNKQKTSMQLQLQNTEIRNQKKEIEKQQKKLALVNKDLQHKNLTLNQLNKDKDYLLHVAAHDLKGPLNQMSGLSQVIRLEQENLSQTQINCVEKIETVSGRLSKMVDKILDIDAIEKKSNNLSLEEIDLREIIDETVEDFESVAKQKHINIHKNLNGGNAAVKVDRQHMLQVFENLVSNAIKFSPPNREVFINLKENPTDVVAEIEDQGPGLTEDDHKKVFKKFQKLSAQPTGNEDSNGLGLSIVKKYVEAMNGKVWVESTPGNGAIFKVSFRKAEVEAA